MGIDVLIYEVKMTIPQKHFYKTRQLLTSLNKKEIAKWMLDIGYYPEQYVLPPCFSVIKYPLYKGSIYKVIIKNNRAKYFIKESELIKIAYPKSSYTMRSFGILEPQIYHDIVWQLMNNWDVVLKTLVGRPRKIFSYSIPIPLDSANKGHIGKKRSGRMIYEFLKMAENDLVAEAYNYRYILKTDITNYYPTVYTHSISWALHGKIQAREDKLYNLLGNKLDRLFQCANDRCTNGIAVGPVVCDLISEIILCSVDANLSKLITKSISYVAVRFKDDYRFLCKSEDDAKKILSFIQKALAEYNLTINEKKTEIRPLPEGLYRDWAIKYDNISLKYESSVNYSKFEKTILTVLQIDREYPDTGIIDKFLSELRTNDYEFRCDFNTEEAKKAFSLLLLLKQRRAKALPGILATVEGMINNVADKEFINYVNVSIEKMIVSLSDSYDDNEYDLLWLVYFSKAVLKKEVILRNCKSLLLKSIYSNKNMFYQDNDFSLFTKIGKYNDKNHLWKHLYPFKEFGIE